MAYSVKDNFETLISTGVAMLAAWSRAQTFTASSTYTATAVSVNCSVFSQPGTFTGGIYATDGGGKPTGVALATFSIVITAETTSPTWSTISTLSPSISLTSGVKYALVIDGTADEIFYWYTDDDSSVDRYAGGEPFVDLGAGAGWVARSSPNQTDHSFRVYSGAAYVFTPPVDIVTYRRLVGAAEDAIWYEDI